MNAPLPAAIRFDIQGLAQAIQHCHASDALRCQFNQPHWDILASYMQPFALNSGQVLMEQGALDRTLYFVESGTLRSLRRRKGARSDGPGRRRNGAWRRRVLLAHAAQRYGACVHTLQALVPHTHALSGTGESP